MAFNEIVTELTTSGVVLEDYIDWLKNILKVTGLTISLIMVFIFIFWIMLNILFSFLAQIFPICRGIILILELVLLPGSIMHNVWHVWMAKKLNIPMEQNVGFGYGWSRVGITLDGRLTTLRDAILFFWAPLLNIPVIIVWVIPGMLLFQWLDTLINGTVFYWIWFYVLISLTLYGLPDLNDLFNPFQITIVKTPEFYIFLIFYVLIAPITLIFWGWGITILLTLMYAIITFYEVQKISRKEENRLKKRYDKMFKKTEQVYIVLDE